MRALLHPVGPEPSRTYWLRRAISIVAIVVVVVLIGWAIGLNQTPAPAVVDTSASSSAPSEPATGISVSVPTAMPSGTALSLPTTCVPAELVLGFEAPDSLTNAQEAPFVVSLASPGGNCVLDLSAQTLEVRVFSGTDRIWSTADCSDYGLTGMREVGVQPVQFSLTWPARRSSPNCGLSNVQLRPGTYVATAELTGVPPVQQIMTIRQG